jgi:hypothetical protein
MMATPPPAALSREERVRNIQAELEKRIDFDLSDSRKMPVEVDFHVLDRYTAYLSFRAAEDYRATVTLLSIIVTGVTVINVLVAIKLL